MRAKWYLVAASLVAWSALPADAPHAADDADLALLETFLDDVETMTASFEQSLVDADDIEVESSSGTLAIRRPGKFRWHYRAPYEQILVADGSNLWSYDVDLEQVTVKPQAEVLADTPAMLLGGDRSVLDEFEVAASERDERGTVWLTLRPRNRDNGFERIDLGFDDGVLRRMMLRDNLDQSTLIALSDVELNATVDPDTFGFEPPAGVDVVGTPLDDDGR